MRQRRNRRSNPRRARPQAGNTLSPPARNPNQNQTVKPRPRRTRKRNRRATRKGPAMTEDGKKFIACAFAPPDFNVDPGRGIPDKYNGRVLLKKHVLTEALSFEQGHQTMIIITPTPGIAYFKATVPIGASFNSSTFVGTTFPQYSSLFPSSNNSNYNVVASRFASLAAGLYPTGNLTAMSGSVQVWKLPLKLGRSSYSQTLALTTPITLAIDTPSIEGLEGIDGMPASNFSTGFVEGMFSQSACNQPEFEFRSLPEGYRSLPLPNVTASQAGMHCTFQCPGGSSINGMGDMDSIVLLVTTPTGAVNTAVLKAWACVEYQPNPGSVFYEFSTTSPEHDPVAMQAYREVANAIPVAVRAVENATFWERVKRILNTVLGAVSYAPGPVGAAATGMNAVINSVHSMFI